MDHRQQLKQNQISHPDIPELPLGGHHEKAELATDERPGELSNVREILDTTTSPSARIIDVGEVDRDLFYRLQDGSEQIEMGSRRTSGVDDASESAQNVRSPILEEAKPKDSTKTPS